MSLLQNIKSFLIRKRLKAQTATRKGEFCNLKDTKVIGILCDVTLVEDLKAFFTFGKSLENLGKQVSMIGYIDLQEIPESHLIHSRISFFNQRDTNWLNLPQEYVTQRLTNTSFDLLINLTPRECLPIEYLMAAGKARMKVGSSHGDDCNYDFMVDLTGKDSIPYLGEQIMYYLETIKSR